MPPISHPARRTLVALLVVMALVLSACGDDDDSSDTDQSSDTELEKPTVESLPEGPVTELVVTDLRKGKGDAAVEGDTVVVHYVGVRSADGTEFDNSYDGGQPFPVGPLGQASVIEGWNQGLVGVMKGSMRQLDIPAALAYGDEPPGEPLQPGDDLTFVVEVLAVIAATSAEDEPKVTVEPTSGTTEVESTDLVDGSGAEAKDGSYAAVQYIAFSGADGTRLDSGWEVGQPLTLRLGAGDLLPGFDEGIIGMKVGGRRQVVMPPEDAFGPDGQAELGLPAGADLIMVFDLLAVY